MGNGAEEGEEPSLRVGQKSRMEWTSRVRRGAKGGRVGGRGGERAEVEDETEGQGRRRRMVRG